MSLDNGDHLEPAPTPLTEADLAPPSPRGYLALAWLAILLIAGLVIFLQASGKKGHKGANTQEAANLVVLEIQMRAMVGMVETIAASDDIPPEKRQETRHNVIAQVEGYNRASVEQRLRVLIVLGELAGPETAKKGLENLVELAKEKEHTLTETEAHRIDLLTRLYDDYLNKRPTAPTVNPEERKELNAHFGWFGELALHPASQIPGEAVAQDRLQVLRSVKQTIVTLSLAGFFVIVVFAIGVVGVLILSIRVLRGKWHSRLGPPVAHHGVYVETFALWLALYVFLMLVGHQYLSLHFSWAVSTCLTMVSSLAALVWPVLRGISWKQVRQDVGLTLGQQPFLEPTFGFLCYALSLPFLAVGFGITMLLTAPFVTPKQVTDPFQADPSMAHPLLEQLANGTVQDWLPLFFFACVLAPIMEEIMFRGVLYRHLRDGTRSWGLLGVVCSVLVVNLVFAAVHPQGALAIPLLASLACGFVLAREWRGTLIPAIIAHGLNNSLILVFAWLCLLK